MDEPIMTKYEYTRIRGIRIQQLIDGMQAFVDIEEGDKEEDIFKKELHEKKIPLKVTRPNGYNTFVEIPVSDMNVERFL
jgi:DNA-directed RNA polymerase subunit K/omega|tara:strand:+ start:1397 stop:1633 length:237 start_codon:yes stop_codon:yes gene_type:complete